MRRRKFGNNIDSPNFPVYHMMGTLAFAAVENLVKYINERRVNDIKRLFNRKCGS